MVKQVNRIKCLCKLLSCTSSIFFRSILIAFLTMLVLNYCMSREATCSSSISSTSAIFTEQYTFRSGFYQFGFNFYYFLKCVDYSGVTTYARSYGMAVGPVSGSIYSSHFVAMPGTYNIIRKVDSSDSQTWIAAFGYMPALKSIFQMDANEQNLYFTLYNTAMYAVRLSTSTGAPVSFEKFTGYSGYNHDNHVWPLSDNSGYYLICKDASNVAYIFRRIFSPSSTKYQKITNVLYGYGQLMLSQTQFFFLGVDSTPGNLHMYKITFLSTATDWANKIACSSGTCSSSNSMSILSADSSTIYSFFTFGSIQYLYFASLSASTGSATSTRYKSSISISNIWALALNGNYLVAITTSSASLIIYNISSETFTFKNCPLTLYWCGVESSTSRIIIIGTNGVNGYKIKFYPQSFSYHPDFSDFSMSMNVLSAGTDDITPETATIGAVTSFTPTTVTLTNQSASYVSGYTSNAYFDGTTQSISIYEGVKSSITLSQTCAFDASTSIVYSTVAYAGSSSVPSWISINSSTGELTMTGPSEDADTEYDFYIGTTVSGVYNTGKKLIKLKVINCEVNNCIACSSSSTSICATCSSGYVLRYGLCLTPSSITADALGSTSTSVVVSSFAVSAAASFCNASSIASFWSMIHQIQMLFLILLYPSFIPEDVRAVIKGPQFSIDLYQYVSVSKENHYQSLFDKFSFASSSELIADIGVQSDSSLYNIHSMLTTILVIVPLHIGLYYFLKCIQKANGGRRCRCCVKLSKVIMTKCYEILTFRYYIRNCIEMFLIVMIYTVYEIYRFRTEDALHIVSLLFSFMIVWFYFVFIALFIYILKTFNTMKKASQSKFHEFFIDLKKDRKYQLYILVFLIRRLIYSIILVTSVTAPTKIIVCIISFLQLCYITYMIIFRPFEDTKVNMIEIINEVYYFFFVFMLVFLQTETDWNLTKISIYIWTLTSNSIIVFSIISIYSLKHFAKFICARCQKNRNKIKQNGRKSTTRVEVIAIHQHLSFSVVNKTVNDKTPDSKHDRSDYRSDCNVYRNNKTGNRFILREESKLDISHELHNKTSNQIIPKFHLEEV